jgi:glycosyltransferase involved in cell wall biosynthesis
MRVCITTEQRFVRTHDNCIWAPAGSPYSFWRRYLDVFDEARVIARIAEVSVAESSWRRADGQGVTFLAAPYYVGPAQYLQKYFALRAAVRRAVGEADAVIMRIASHIGACLESTLATGRPFGLELIGDPYDVFAPGSIEHPLRPFLRWWFTRTVKRECRKASTVAYVTTASLQSRYRSDHAGFSTSYSSIELSQEAFAESPRSFGPKLGHIRIVSVGSLEQMYKGFDVLIDAVATCLGVGLDLELVLIGDGRYRPELERRVQTHGIERKVTFVGHIPDGGPVREHLDRAHLFVLPSKTEGLPKALIEAMARGLPCVGSAVGGIPELLPFEDLVARGDVGALARKLVEVVSQPERMTRMSIANLARAGDFRDSVLRPRRRQFLEHLRKATQEWARGQGMHSAS